MRGFLRLGCLFSAMLAALLGTLLYTTDLGTYFRLYTGALVGAAVGIAEQQSNYDYVEAEVVVADIDDNPVLGPRGTLTLRYEDSNGRRLLETSRVFSQGSRLARVKPGDRLSISLCRRDPRIIKSYDFTIQGARECPVSGE